MTSLGFEFAWLSMPLFSIVNYLLSDNELLLQTFCTSILALIDVKDPHALGVTNVFFCRSGVLEFYILQLKETIK